MLAGRIYAIARWPLSDGEDTGYMWTHWRGGGGSDQGGSPDSPVDKYTIHLYDSQDSIHNKREIRYLLSSGYMRAGGLAQQ